MQFLTLLILSYILEDMNLVASYSSLVNLSDSDVQNETVPAGQWTKRARNPAGAILLQYR